jgi:hypothetical protein
MALLRLQNEANRLTLQPTKQSLKHQLPPTLNRSYPYRASGLVHGSFSDNGLARCEPALMTLRHNGADEGPYGDG